MATNNNLHDFLLDLASAIRQKTGDTATINPQDFSTKIKNLKNSSVENGASVAELTGLTPKYYKMLKLYNFSSGSESVHNFITFLYTGSLFVHPSGLIVSNTFYGMKDLSENTPDGLYILEYEELASNILPQLGFTSHTQYLEMLYSEFPEATGSVVEVSEEEFFEAMRNAASNL